MADGLRKEEEETDNNTHIHRWGYVVCFGTIVTFVACIGHVNSFGLIYNDFIVDTHSSAKSMTTAHGLFAMMLAIGGIILNIISKHHTLRTGGFIGSILFITGSFMTIFIANVNQLTITYGILQGIGFGIMVPVCYSMINQYFTKRRTTAISFCKSIQGLVQTVYPQALKEIMNKYGFHGTLLILSGISLHTIFGMLTMLPQVKPRRLKRNMFKGLPDGDLQEKTELVNPTIGNGTNCDKINSQRLCDIWMCKIFKVIDYLNLKLFKDPVFCNICICLSFVNFSDITFFILQPMLLFQNGFNNNQVAACISTGAGADLAGRCIMAIISCSIAVNTRILFYAAVVLTMLGRIAMLQLSGFTAMVSTTAVLGLLRAWLHISSPLVVADSVSKEDFPGAYGLSLLITGLVNMACNPVIGLIKDVYGDFTPAFYGLVLCCLPCVLCWPLEYITTRRKAIVNQ